MLRVPEPHKDDFVVEISLPHGSRMMLCDRDIHPIRQQVQDIVDGQEAPLEWATLANVDGVLEVFEDLRRYIRERQTLVQMGALVPVAIQEAINQCRWKLIGLVTEALFGDRKFRAARYYQMPLIALRRLAKIHCLKGRSGMRKHQLVYALVEAGL